MKWNRNMKKRASLDYVVTNVETQYSVQNVIDLQFDLTGSFQWNRGQCTIPSDECLVNLQ